VRAKDPALPKRDLAAYESAQAGAFAAIPKSLPALVGAGLVFARYAPTAKGLAAARSGTLASTDLAALVRDGFVAYEGMRYEDFLPVSAAGIFASNLQQYGTKSTAAVKPTYSQALLEEILGRKIVDATAMYAAFEAESKLATYEQLGLLASLPAGVRAELEQCAAPCRA
jgi:uncharacterized glyoxalase superfamily metalloenzyme YdcJ